MATRNYYELLGVSYEAGANEIHSAYDELKAKFNPDLFPSNSKQAKRFRHIRAAKRTLLDPKKRKKYDYLLVQEGILKVQPNIPSDNGGFTAEVSSETDSSFTSQPFNASDSFPPAPATNTPPTPATNTPPTPATNTPPAPATNTPPPVLPTNTQIELQNKSERWKHLQDDATSFEGPSSNGSLPMQDSNTVSPAAESTSDPGLTVNSGPSRVSVASRRSRKNQDQFSGRLIQLVMLPMGGIAGISVAILLLWVAFRIDPFGLFGDNNVQGAAQSSISEPQKTNKSDPPLEKKKSPKERKRENDRALPLDPPAKPPGKKTGTPNSDATKPFALPKNSPRRLMSLGLNEAAQTCQRFDWWPTNEKQTEDLQRFLDCLVTLQQVITTNPDNDPDVPILGRQRDHWLIQFRDNFRPPEGRLADTKSVSNQRFGNIMRSGPCKFAVFATLNEEPAKLNDRVEFRITGTDQMIGSNVATNWPPIEAGRSYLLIGEVQAVEGDEQPASVQQARVVFLSSDESNKTKPMENPVFPDGPPVLDEKLIAKAQDTLHELYAEHRKELDQMKWNFKDITEFRAKQDMMVALHKKIFASHQNAPNPSEKFAIIQYALELAIETGDSSSSYLYIEKLKIHFQIDDLLLLIKAIKAWDKRIKNLAGEARREKRKELADQVVGLANRAYQENRFSEAAELFKICDTLTPSDEDRKQSLGKMHLHSQQLAKKHPRMMEIQEELKSDGDPPRGLKLGKYWCFEVGDWETGLPLLQNGSDPKFIKPAELDLAGGKTRDQRKAIADAWFNLFTISTGQDQQGIATRAVMLYEDLLDEYTDIDRKIIEKRIGELKEKGISGPVDTQDDH